MCASVRSMKLNFVCFDVKFCGAFLHRSTFTSNLIDCILAKQSPHGSLTTWL